MIKPNDYEGLTERQRFELFEDNVYERMGMPTDRIEINETLNGLATKIGELNVDPCQLRAKVWEVAPKRARRALLIGRLVNFGLYVRSRPSLNAFAPHGLDELVDYSRQYDELAFTADAVSATNEEHVVVSGSVPSIMLDPSVAVYRASKRSRQSHIERSLIPLRFSDRWTDSEEMDDPHPVHGFLLDEELNTRFRQILLNAADIDAKQTKYKPHVWQRRLEITLRALSASTTDEMRFQARSRLHIPVQDDKYKAHKVAEKAAIKKISDSKKELRAAAYENRKSMAWTLIHDTLPATESQQAWVAIGSPDSMSDEQRDNSGNY